MKILKVYDKINRNIVHYDYMTSTLTIREFYNKIDYNTVIINPRLFNLKSERMAYFSFIETINNVATKTLNITGKYIFFNLMNEDGMLIHSERIHLKDNKSILLIDRIYDDMQDYIEIENHRGNKTLKFTVKDDIINNILNKK